jgi:hypothetical protein
MIEFTENGLAGRDPALAGLFEREIAEAAAAIAKAVCRIEAEGADPQAPDRARVVLVENDKVFEWTVALPAAPGDVSRATHRALSGRRRLGERRRPARKSLDRRRP